MSEFNEAVMAGAKWLHDYECNDGLAEEAPLCGRWKAGINPGSQFYKLHAPHIDYYYNLAQGVLEAAAKSHTVHRHDED